MFVKEPGQPQSLEYQTLKIMTVVLFIVTSCLFWRPPSEVFIFASAKFLRRRRTVLRRENTLLRRRHLTSSRFRKVSIVNFEHISHRVLVFLLLTLIR